MLTIRLARGGAKKKPYYSIVVTDSRNARDSGSIKEKLGYFNPVARGNELTLHMDLERVNHWVQNGAQTSDKVGQLVKIFNKSQKSGEKASMRNRASLSEKAKAQAAAEAEAAAKAEAEAAAKVEALETETQEAAATEKESK